ncbi:tRNA-uridine aminocarboxypropyltransferase 1 isoform X2 [Puntigrus tetrazona]|uniref:tRNA-uridine aminocarboxypropyltransferase 1 isoform X2 n=1 Tax=Puntigrus tetrazona TaxID=1606681 RepID=UPI001C896CC1|nr:tRNA-uridine aminocarboxypropyltransferase 1 isoform X2 [Puntigrus tetrazona]
MFFFSISDLSVASVARRPLGFLRRASASGACGARGFVVAMSAEESSALSGLRIASHAPLDAAQLAGRRKCSRCGASRMFFCYSCCALVGLEARDVPSVEIVLVFPGPDAMTVEELWEHFSGGGKPRVKRLKVTDADPETRRCPIQRVVFIDSTWNQTTRIITDERLQALPNVELKSRRTCFWRHQKGCPDTYLATIEAVYYFLKDLHGHYFSEYEGEYDNLLFFFSFLHKLINKAKQAAGKV